METALSLLEQNGLLNSWFDHKILPGQSISSKIQTQMKEADIIVFLISPDFIASTECIKEWELAKNLANGNRSLFRIPIILRECAWMDLLGSDDIKALPNDGHPVAKFDDKDTAWYQVYEGIKRVIDELRNTFTPKPEFVRALERTDFLSQEHIRLQDIFVFLPLQSVVAPQKGSSQYISPRQNPITDLAQLLKKKFTLIFGDERSGKTALGRYVFLSLIEQSCPVLYVDLAEVSGRPTRNFFRTTYESQFNGDYSIWVKQNEKTLIVDNLSGRPQLVDFIMSAKDTFDRIIVMSSTSTFLSFYMDEERLADFEVLRIDPLTHVLQEELIRKRLQLSNQVEQLTHGYIDQIENRVNSVIINDKLVPRYPFFVLAILQTYEAYMPSGMSITSYGHCYQALIVASIIRAGISNQDSDINACFNFAEQLAFRIYRHRQSHNSEPFNFDDFVREYLNLYHIRDSTINRLKHTEFGIINADGQFKTPFMYYYFLGKFLSNRGDENELRIQEMCNAAHISSNYLTLIFAIHHSSDTSIIDNILLRTSQVLDDIQPAKLDKEETRRFESLVSGIPKNILSNQDVESSRKQIRAVLDEVNSLQTSTDDNGEVDDNTTSLADESYDNEIANEIYRVLKNNEIIGQVLRNQYGRLEKSEIEKIIRFVSDGGLRLVNLAFKSEDAIVENMQYVKAKNPDHDFDEIIDGLEALTFLWTIINITQITDALNVPEVRRSISNVVRQTRTPAYDLVGYFLMLDTATELKEPEKEELDRLLKDHDDPFVRSVLSLRTQHYLNTHRSRAPMEQAICSLLGIRYFPRYR